MDVMGKVVSEAAGLGTSIFIDLNEGRESYQGKA